MGNFDDFIDKEVMIELSGKIKVTGILIDFGLDIIVVYDGNKYIYIPLSQVQNIQFYSDIIQMEEPKELPFDLEVNKISLRKILNNAKGVFVELYVIGNQTIHGYITNILTDYLVFYTPVYKTMFISLKHLKWLSPYPRNTTPYSLSSEHLPVNPSNILLPRSFEEQLKRMEGNIVIFDIGDNPLKIGLLHKTENNMVTLINGEGEKILWNLTHLKTVHLP